MMNTEVMKDLQATLSTGTYSGKVDVSFQTTLSTVMVRSRIVNPQITLSESLASLQNRNKTTRADISFRDIKSITPRTFYDGKCYCIEYDNGLLMTVTFMP